MIIICPNFCAFFFYYIDFKYINIDINMYKNLKKKKKKNCVVYSTIFF